MCNTEFLLDHWMDLTECLSQTTVPIEQFSVSPHGLWISMIVMIPDYLPDLRVLNLSIWTAGDDVRGCSSLLI